MGESGIGKKNIEELVEKLNKDNSELQYHAAWSNECIEFWFLLHFAYYTANNHRSEYIMFLNDKFQKIGLGKYQKKMTLLHLGRRIYDWSDNYLSDLFLQIFLRSS